MTAASSAMVTDSNFVRNDSLYGGALVMEMRASASAQIQNCDFLYNFAETSGGAFGVTLFSDANLAFSSCEFLHNTASTGPCRFDTCEGGAMSLFTSNMDTVVEDCVISNNTAFEAGGGIASRGRGGLALTRSLFDSNKVVETGSSDHIVTDGDITTCDDTNFVNPDFSSGVDITGSSACS